MWNRFLRHVLRASDKSEPILLQRPDDLSGNLFEAHDALMKALDAAWAMEDPQLYDEVYQLVRRLAVLIDKNGR
ncbi:hypothetical protein [Hyphomicrobium sp.]|uniref:hypothetical protein n=1 Tax=Hyphomicrobium sp. TaxID=82 RepID=UPI002D767FB5|nr:hypothetical protein [Hyphomicrobium sp.]HET6388316.1 hypothetical protein [Hyphomicrobium sp.]